MSNYGGQERKLEVAVSECKTCGKKLKGPLCPHCDSFKKWANRALEVADKDQDGNQFATVTRQSLTQAVEKYWTFVQGDFSQTHDERRKSASKMTDYIARELGL